jgi:lysophospholipase L1-like esterase
MKKTLLFVMSILLCASSFVGCSSGTSDESAGGSTGESGASGAETSDTLNMADFPLWVEPSKATYKFDLEEMVSPYFKGNVIYNETVMLIDENGTISGNLQYAPLRILSVRDYTWEKEYAASEYTVSGKTITMSEGGTMPYLTAENIQGKNIPEPYRQVSSITNIETDWVLMGGAVYTEGSLIYGHQISVSYVYDPRDLKKEDFADYATSGYPKLKAKLSNGENVKMVMIGDSVGEGCSSSGQFNHAPYMDNFATLVKKGLEAKYESTVTLDNQAVGGKTSEWGSASAQVNKIIAAAPDIVLIHFGINDLGSDFSQNGFRDNIQSLILDVQSALPDCEFMIIEAFGANPLLYDYNMFQKYWNKMEGLAEEIDNVYTLDMFTLSKTMFESKKYMDVTGNGINHLNDYSSRLYAMNILSALIEY